MNNFYYSQRYYAYANEKIDEPNITMGQFGCVITCCAMIISYFNDRPLYPDQFLRWLREYKGLTADGRLYWNKVSEATANKLRFSYFPDIKMGENTVYTLRQVYFGRLNHWIIDHPLIPHKVIDPWDGQVKDFTQFRYTGQSRCFNCKK